MTTLIRIEYLEGTKPVAIMPVTPEGIPLQSHPVIINGKGASAKEYVYSSGKALSICEAQVTAESPEVEPGGLPGNSKD